MIGCLGAGALRLLAPDGVISEGDATALFGAVVAASSALGTLAITPIAIVLALTPGPRLKALLSQHLTIVRVAMGWTVLCNLLAVAVGVIGLAADNGKNGDDAVRFLVVALEFASLLAMCRLVWFFLALLRLDDVDRSANHSDLRT